MDNKPVAEKPWLAMRAAVAVLAASTTADAIDTLESLAFDRAPV
jgi:hypothetical protein